MAQLPGRDISFLFILLPVAIWLTSSFLSAAAWAPASLTRLLFTLAGALFNFGLVCPAFSPGRVYFGRAPV